MKVTFRRDPRATGLARVTQGTRGWQIIIDGVRQGGISLLRRDEFGPVYGQPEEPRWYYYLYSKSGVSDEVINTCAAPKTVDECKAEIRKLVKEASKRVAK